MATGRAACPRRAAGPHQAAALVPYLAGGSYAGVLDGGGASDTTSPDSRYTVYELRSLLEMDDRVLVPTLLALDVG